MLFMGWQAVEWYNKVYYSNNLLLRKSEKKNYREIPKISPSKYKPPKPVTQKTLR